MSEIFYVDTETYKTPMASQLRTEKQADIFDFFKTIPSSVEIAKGSIKAFRESYLENQNRSAIGTLSGRDVDGAIEHALDRRQKS